MDSKELEKTYFGAAFTHLLKTKDGLTRAKIGEILGVSGAYIGSIAKGKKRAFELRDSIAGIYGYTTQDFLRLGQQLIEKGTSYNLPPAELPKGLLIPGANPIVRRLPVISFVQAGNWHEAIDNFQPGDADEWVTTTSNLSEQAFSLRVVGKSMEPEFWEGEFINVDPNAEVNSGDYIIAKNGNEEATFKKYYKDGDRHFLIPLNEDWGKPRDMTGHNWRIVGRVMEKVKKY